jgi:hypothetical protein
LQQACFIGLLRDQFGQAFDHYRRRVGWLVPKLGSRRP